MASNPPRASARLSNFRFSLMPSRSPMSPVSPASVHEPHLANNADQSLSICHSSGRTSPTARGSPSLEKDHDKVIVTAVNEEDSGPRAFPSASGSPMTPWHLSFHRNAAGVDQESAYLAKATKTHVARLILSLLLVVTAAVVVGVENDVIYRYRTSTLGADYELSLWPSDLDLRPTWLCLATGAVVMALVLISQIASVLPSPKPRTKLNITLFTFQSVITAVLSLVTIIFAGVISPGAIFGNFVVNTVTDLLSTTGPGNTSGLSPGGAANGTKRETIQSFTCAIANSAKSFNKNADELKLPSMNPLEQIVPAGFAKTCAESHAVLALVVVIAILGAISVAVAGYSWITEAKIRKLRIEREVLASRDGRNVPESLVGMRYEKNSLDHSVTA